MNPRTTYFIGLACLLLAAVLAFLRLQSFGGVGSQFTSTLIMIIGIVFIIRSRLARR
jgi:hypothetical protein